MRSLINKYLNSEFQYRLLPFLFLYLAICFVFAPLHNVGDESRYLYFANNLLKGFYSPPYPDYNLWNGPGYPLFLSPFIFLKIPLLYLRFLNGLLLFSSLLISFKTISIFASKKSAYIFTVILGLYFPIFEMLPLIFTECLTWFLICLFCYLFSKSYLEKEISWRLTFLTSFILAFLAMTKVIFGYVIAIMIIVSLFTLLFSKLRTSAKKSGLIFLISFIFCLPWLYYTHSLTNKLFYWTNSGSMSLYTMSAPFPNELGDWKSEIELKQNPNHKAFMDSIENLNSLERDEAFKNAAIKNIKKHPNKYFSNWLANIGRLLFSYPFSNQYNHAQNLKTYWFILPNMFIIVILALTLPLSIVNLKKFPDSLIYLFIFFTIYLFGCTLVSTYRRMFYVTLPYWFLFISFVFNKLVSVKINKD